MSTEPQTGPQATWERYLDEGRFMLQRVRGSGEHLWWPRVATPSGETDLEWVEASGGGTIHAITVSRSRSGTINVALIDLDEGVRMMSTLPGVETAPIGTRVVARIETVGEAPRVVFDLAGGAGA
jgi:uncharacterized OB-fold protein